MVFSRLAPLLGRNGKHAIFIRDTSYFLFAFATWIPAAAFFKYHVGEIASVHGPSMYPYLNTDFDRSLKQDVCWINKWKAIENVQRGMIVTFWSPSNPEVLAVKRVIAKEGDKVFTRGPWPQPIVTVPVGHVWVEGDGGQSGKQSLDSNTYGPISINLIEGKVTHVLWPRSSFGPIRWWEFKGKTRVIKASNDKILT